VGPAAAAKKQVVPHECEGTPARCRASRRATGRVRIVDGRY